MHKQTFVKVNVEVDEGIAPVVEALSLFPDVHTFESCQGEKENHHTMSAVVYFRVGSLNLNPRKSLQITSAFALETLAPELWNLVNDSASVTVEYCNGYSYDVTIRMFPASIQKVAFAIKKIWRLRNG